MIGQGDSFFDHVRDFAVWVVVIVILGVIVLGGAYGYGRLVCRAQAAAMGRPYIYNLLHGCMVGTDRGFYPVEQVHVDVRK